LVVYRIAIKNNQSIFYEKYFERIIRSKNRKKQYGENGLIAEIE
jgi:hypothetical protein